jgi:predicted Holliday junction resolvase-like endonuclease
MSGSEVAAVVVAVTAGIALTVLVVVLVHLLRTIRKLQDTVEALRLESLAAVEQLHEAERRTNEERERVDNLLRSAESVSDTVDSATRLAYLTVGSPVVKGLALATGANQAYRRFRGVRGN